MVPETPRPPAARASRLSHDRGRGTPPPPPSSCRRRARRRRASPRPLLHLGSGAPTPSFYHRLRSPQSRRSRAGGAGCSQGGAWCPVRSLPLHPTRVVTHSRGGTGDSLLVPLQHLPPVPALSGFPLPTYPLWSSLSLHFFPPGLNPLWVKFTAAWPRDLFSARNLKGRRVGRRSYRRGETRAFSPNVSSITILLRAKLSVGPSDRHLVQGGPGTASGSRTAV